MSTVYILDRHRSACGHWLAWRAAYSGPVQVVDDFDLDWQPEDDAGLIVCVQHFRAPEVSILRRITAVHRIPVLIQADGILEYRNTWERLDNPPGTIYQPVLGHKIACIGRSQARVLEAWGNHGKCEVVGIPRLATSDREIRRSRKDNVWRIMIATAKCPAFTDEQRRLVVASLIDLKNWFEHHGVVGTRRIEVCWRLTGGLEQDVGLKPSSLSPLHVDLTTQLAEADAVVTTPSTLLLEAMWQAIPTAILDYTNSPSYVPAAWSITAAVHRDRVLTELANPSSTKLRLQESLLHDSLECRGSAVSRMVCLIEEMVRWGQRCRKNGEALRLPHRILTEDSLDHESSVGGTPPLPMQPVAFGYEEQAAMQLEIEHLKKLLRSQTAELTALRESVSESLQRKVVRGFARALGHVLK